MTLDAQLDAVCKQVVVYFQMLHAAGIPIHIESWADAIATNVEQIERQAA